MCGRNQPRPSPGELTKAALEHIIAPRFANDVWELSITGHVLFETGLLPDHALERQQHVHHLLTVARLLDVGELAAAAIGDAGLRDL